MGLEKWASALVRRIARRDGSYVCQQRMDRLVGKQCQRFRSRQSFGFGYRYGQPSGGRQREALR